MAIPRLPQDNCLQATATMSNCITYVGDGDFALILPPVPSHIKIPPTCLVQKEKINHLVVPSEILTNVSPVFRAMLGGNFLEGKTLKRKRSVEVELGEDAVAMEIFLDMIYLVNANCSTIPNGTQKPFIDLETFTEVACLFDKYRVVMNKEFQDAAKEWTSLVPDTQKLQFKGDRDIDNILNVRNTSIVFSWICIAWVFKMPKEFADYTRCLIMDCTPESIQHILEQYRNMGVYLPIPDQIFEKIEESRWEIIAESIAEAVYNISEFSWLTPIPCKKHESGCLGRTSASLTRSARANGLWPLPQYPYQGLTLRTLWNNFKLLKIGHCRIWKGTRSGTERFQGRVEQLVERRCPEGLKFWQIEELPREFAKIKDCLMIRGDPSKRLEEIFAPSHISWVEESWLTYTD